MSKILDIKNLKVEFPTDYGTVYAVRGIDFSLYEGESLAIVGESGCGKSVTVKALMRLLDPSVCNITASSIYLDDLDLMQLSENQMRDVRGNLISMIFQDPMTSLNPTMKIGDQIMEGYRLHYPLVTKKQATTRVLELLHLVKIPDPEMRMCQYPHHLSGGMRQRVCIAMALVTNPKIIIADEPTTALDVTIQVQILQLLKEIQKKMNMSFIFITHDLSVVANFADRILVMYAGEIVEEAKKNELFKTPSHPYTKLLLRSIPRIDRSKEQQLQPIEGSPPNLMYQQKGCAFFDRCPYAMNICNTKAPPMFALPNDQASLCWLHDKRAKGINHDNQATDPTSDRSLSTLSL
ncbi:MAG: ABC transporter ATP-binding protein [Chlamydiales bacterium]|nr:ABC transporter ATP-binding protein [Chlamydiales bacterium]